MNRDQFQPKTVEKNNDEDGENDYFFDCAILDKLQAAAKLGQEELNNRSEFNTVGDNNK